MIGEWYPNNGVGVAYHVNCTVQLDSGNYIAMFGVISPFVINVPTRDLLVPYTKRTFQIRVRTLALQFDTIAMFVNTKHAIYFA